jgi:hypothetical protein
MPTIAIGQVMQTKVHTSRIRSLVDGKVAMANSAQKPATRKPAIAHIAIRYFITATSAASIILRLSGLTNLTRKHAISFIEGF